MIDALLQGHGALWLTGLAVALVATAASARSAAAAMLEADVLAARDIGACARQRLRLRSPGHWITRGALLHRFLEIACQRHSA